MKNKIQLFLLGIALISSCKKEHDHDHNHDTNDTSSPVVTVNSPTDSTVYHNGDTVFISGSVTDNDLHGGTILLKNDTSAVEYLNQYHNVHQLTSANFSYQYILNGITQTEAVTLTVSYEDHIPNTNTVTRHLVFMP